MRTRAIAHERARNVHKLRRVRVQTCTLAENEQMRLVAGMVGGGPGAMIGAAHRHAMWLDNQYVLAAGIFGRNHEASAQFADELGVERVYRDHREMVEKEAGRLDVVAVVTPNDTHFEIAKAFLEAGISVVCEKPLTNDSATAAELVAIAESNNVILAVPHIYSAYPMVRHAARMVRNGDLGRVRRRGKHASGWASADVEQWRMDPDRGGVATAVADVGTHAFHLLRYITGLEASRVSAELSTLVAGRPVFDNATMRLTLSNGAPATVWATMAATGHEHGLRIRVFGDDASLEWHHEDPQHLVVRDPGAGSKILAQGMSTLSEDAGRLNRAGLGHPEGFLEAFANFYLDLADILRGRTARDLSIPTGIDGLIGVQLVEATVASHANDAAWVDTSFGT